MFLHGPDGEETRFIITVDGTHCRIEEPTLESFMEQRMCHSHKFKMAGLDCEVALSIFEPKSVCVLLIKFGKNDMHVIVFHQSHPLKWEEVVKHHI